MKQLKIAKADLRKRWYFAVPGITAKGWVGVNLTKKPKSLGVDTLEQENKAYDDS